MPFRMGRREFLRGLWSRPRHEIAYDIAGSGVSAFSAWAGYMADRHCHLWRDPSLTTRSACQFLIYVDGDLRAQSGLLKVIGGAPRLLVVEGLEKAKTLRLVARRADDRPGLWATWGDPTFTGGKLPPALVERYRKDRRLRTDPPDRAIGQWAFLGPFHLDPERHHLDPKDVDFKATHAGRDAKHVAWRKVAADEDGVLRLEKLAASPAYTTSYCCAVLESPRPQLAEIGLGASGQWNTQVTFWLNGEPLYATTGMGLVKNRVRLLKDLKAGRNTLLVRLDEKGATGGVVVTCRGEGLVAGDPPVK